MKAERRIQPPLCSICSDLAIGFGKFDLVPSYRYQWINDGEDGLDDTTAHVLRVGLRFWFN